MTIANGASELIKFLFNYFKEKKVGVLIPTFEEFLRFPFINVFNVLNYKESKYNIYNIFLENNKNLEDFIKQNDIVVIVNPNNPLGYYIESGYLADLALRYPEKIFIIDESFIDFYDYKKSVLYFMEELEIKNLIVIKSLGKIWGIPGLRGGILFALNPNIIEEYKRFISLWNINSILELLLQIYPKYHKDYLHSLLRITHIKQKFEVFLKSLKIPYFKSYANFVTIDLGNIDSLQFCAKAFDELIFLKNLKGKKGLEKQNYIRIGIKSEEYMQNLMYFLLKEIKTS